MPWKNRVSSSLRSRWIGKTGITNQKDFKSTPSGLAVPIMWCRWSRLWTVMTRFWFLREKRRASPWRQPMRLRNFRAFLSSEPRSVVAIVGWQWSHLPTKKRSRSSNARLLWLKLRSPHPRRRVHWHNRESSSAPRICAWHRSLWFFPDREPTTPAWAKNFTRLFPSSRSGWIGRQRRRILICFIYYFMIGKRIFRKLGGNSRPCSPWNTRWLNTSSVLVSAPWPWPAIVWAN